MRKISYYSQAFPPPQPLHSSIQKHLKTFANNIVFLRFAIILGASILQCTFFTQGKIIPGYTNVFN